MVSLFWTILLKIFTIKHICLFEERVLICLLTRSVYTACSWSRILFTAHNFVDRHKKTKFKLVLMSWTYSKASLFIFWDLLLLFFLQTRKLLKKMLTASSIFKGSNVDAKINCSTMVHDACAVNCRIPVKIYSHWFPLGTLLLLLLAF